MDIGGRHQTGATVFKTAVEKQRIAISADHL
jgi:hypothetical protein